jgi:hypothetical protein
MKFPKNNSVFSSAIGATPNPIDKKKYFYPTPQPAPAPAPTPITPPLPINEQWIVEFYFAKANNATK